MAVLAGAAFDFENKKAAIQAAFLDIKEQLIS